MSVEFAPNLVDTISHKFVAQGLGRRTERDGHLAVARFHESYVVLEFYQRQWYVRSTSGTKLDPSIEEALRLAAKEGFAEEFASFPDAAKAAGLPLSNQA